ncbi:DUF4169 family protein [Niveispirillum sp. SYP-B3756]|uniref:DUF4169 family protein n=1 Tax=Niveispirillum sp. SYP-B3756 TaxID=2662178 RepID=UPI001290F59B|nr:DUF4169 family protein [Niveispirillum sp. SYP-B3756]MQP65202.1 DUF4169 family protein [Niveispirillum sp. SYP-B3756]
MGEIVNLNRARKAKEKAARESQAAENRVKFGRTKAEKQKSRAEDEAKARLLEGHKLDKPDQ